MAKAKLKPQAKKKVTARQAQLLAQLKTKKPSAPMKAPVDAEDLIDKGADEATEKS